MVQTLYRCYELQASLLFTNRLQMYIFEIKTFYGHITQLLLSNETAILQKRMKPPFVKS